MVSVSTRRSRRERTRQGILRAALDLFEEQGYTETTTAQIAAAAGVSEMTVFRHFASKDRLLLDDPYDPVIAAAVGAQPSQLPPLARVAAGLRAAWRTLPEPESEDVRRRLRIAVRTPSLAGAMRANTRATEEAVADALTAAGTDRGVARIAAAAGLAALTAALLEWAQADGGTLEGAVRRGLRVLDGEP